MQKNYPGLLFQSLFRAHHNAVHAGMTQAGVEGVGSPRLLLAVRDRHLQGETPSQRELADLLRVSPATIATSLKSLERQGYVERQRDAVDCRRNLISITQRGLDALDQSRQVMDQVDRAMFAGFSQEEFSQLQAFHNRMLQNLYAVGGDQDAPCPPPPPERMC